MKRYVEIIDLNSLTVRELINSYMNRHVEVSRFEMVCHFAKTLQAILSFTLFKAIKLGWFAASLETEKSKEKKKELLSF